MHSQSTKQLNNARYLLLFLLITFFTLSLKVHAKIVKENGWLSVENGKIVNQDKQVVSLAGPSLFWSNNGWEGEKFYNTQTVNAFVTDWNASIIRAAMAAQGDGSYLSHPEVNQNKVERVVKAAIENDIYVIIDWHSHHAEKNIAQAEQFFTNMAKKYHQYPNVIYEIYNEPLQTTDWKTVIKPYAEQIIAAIRAIDKNNLIIVGTQSWSQDVDKAANDPIQGFDNIVYALHFYAGSHQEKLREKAQKALNAGIALFVSEWGTVDADGNGNIDKTSTEQWLSFIKENELSHCTWSVSNKNESSAILKPNTSSLGPWGNNELTDNGVYLKNIIKNWNIK